VPYIARLYLTPPSSHFDLTYLVGGRVLYFPFTIVALGLAGSKIPFPAIWLLAYANALRIYSPADFMSLSIVQGHPAGSTPWLPFANNQYVWFAALAAWFALRKNCLLTKRA